MTTSVEQIYQLLDKWAARCSELQYVHYTAGNIYARRNYSLGFPVVVLSATAGTSLFASIQTHPSTFALVATGLVSMSVAVLASLQTFLRFSERAEQYRMTGVRYGVIKRRIEQMSVKTMVPDAETEQFLDNIREEIDTLAKDAPGVPGSIYRKAKAQMHFAEHDQTESVI